MAAFVPFLVFFMLSWQDHVRASTVMLFSVESRQTAFVTLGLISQMIRGFIVGNFIIGMILGITSSIAFWILGVPYFYVIGMISGIVSLLPYLGIVLAIVPPVIVSLGLLTTERFVAIVAVVAVSHVIALNLLYPKIIGRRLQSESPGGNPGSALLGLALGSHGTGTGRSAHGRPQNHLRPRGQSAGLGSLAGRVMPAQQKWRSPQAALR